MYDMYEKSYDDVSAWCPSSQVERPSVAELMKDKFNGDIFTEVMSMVGHVYAFHEEKPPHSDERMSRQEYADLVEKRATWEKRHEADEHQPPNLTPLPGDISSFVHWKKINVDENYGYSLQTYLLANHRSVNEARRINSENLHALRWAKWFVKVDNELYEDEDEKEEDAEDEEEDDDSEEEHVGHFQRTEDELRTPYAKYLLEHDEYYDYNDHAPAVDKWELSTRFCCGLPQTLPYFQVHPIRGFAYL